MKHELKTVDACPHDISEQDVAAQADGLCPLCLQAEVARLNDAFDYLARSYAARTTEAREINELRAAAESKLAKAREIIRPFAGDKMPPLQKTERAFNRYGLRCLMSPMEIARTAARAFLKEK